LCVCMYVCVCVHVCVYVCMYVCACVRACVRACVWAGMGVFVCQWFMQSGQPHQTAAPTGLGAGGTSGGGSFSEASKVSTEKVRSCAIICFPCANDCVRGSVSSTDAHACACAHTHPHTPTHMPTRARLGDRVAQAAALGIECLVLICARRLAGALCLWKSPGIFLCVCPCVQMHENYNFSLPWSSLSKVSPIAIRQMMTRLQTYHYSHVNCHLVKPLYIVTKYIIM